MIIENMELDEKIVEIIPPLTPDWAANIKHMFEITWMSSCVTPLLKAAENLSQVSSYTALPIFGGGLS